MGRLVSGRWSVVEPAPMCCLRLFAIGPGFRLKSMPVVPSGTPAYWLIPFEYFEDNEIPENGVFCWYETGPVLSIGPAAPIAKMPVVYC